MGGKPVPADYDPFAAPAAPAAQPAGKPVPAGYDPFAAPAPTAVSRPSPFASIARGAGHVVAQNAREFGPTMEAEIKPATDAFWADVSPIEPLRSLSRGNVMPWIEQTSGAFEGKPLADLANVAWSPAQGVIDYLLGRPVATGFNALTGKHATPAQAGGLIGAALPVAGEAAEMHSIAAEAKAAGMSESAIRAMRGASEASARQSLAAWRAKHPTIIDRAGGAITRPVVKTYKRVTQQVPAKGQSLLKEAPTEAAHQVRAAMRAAGTTPNQMREEAAKAKAAGVPRVSAITVGGEPVRHTLRSAALQSGRVNNWVSKLADKLRISGPGEAAARVAKLTPWEKRAAPDVRAGLVERARTEADTNFPTAYATTIVPEKGDLEALNNSEVLSASGILDSEIKTSELRLSAKKPGAKEELRSLRALKQYFAETNSLPARLSEWKRNSYGSFGKPLDPEARAMYDDPNVSLAVKNAIKRNYDWTQEPKPVAPTPPKVTGGALHRIRMGIHQRQHDLTGTVFQRGENPSRGAAMVDVRKSVDSILDKVPGMKPAMAAYKDILGQIEALDLGAESLPMDPASLKLKLKELGTGPGKKVTPGQMKAAGVGRRHALEQHFRHRPGETIGWLEHLQSPSVHEGNAHIFGVNEAESLRDFAKYQKNNLTWTQRANPGTGSQTAPMEADVGQLRVAETAVSPLASAQNKAIRLMEKATKGMTEAEKRWVARNVTGDLDAFLDRALTKVKIAPEPVDPQAVRRAAFGGAGAHAATAGQNPPAPDAYAPGDLVQDEDGVKYRVVKPNPDDPTRPFVEPVQ